jgi:hypothetical protein
VSPATLNPAVLQRKVHYILHRALVQIRQLARSRDHDHIADLADTMEVVPSLLDQEEANGLAVLLEVLGQYQARHPGTAFDYLSILQMDDAAFQNVYRSW